jgi:SHS family lactate transporter-like MFS transporter
MVIPGSTAGRPWYRQVSADQWRAFWAAYLGWALDGFDFSILTFVLVDVQRSFEVNNTLAGALLSIGALFRVVGGVGAGLAADRWGRRGPLMFSILCYSLLTFLSGFSTTYGMLFACRALFGIGMGGVWAAGMPLALEHWPAHLRGTASGLLQSAYATGIILMAVIYQLIHPLLIDRGDLAWRFFFWIGILPSFLVLWIMRSVKESPVWLERQRHIAEVPDGARGSTSLGRLFKGELLGITIQATVLMASLLSMYYSMNYLYPTFLQRMGRQTLPFIMMFNVAGIAGGIACGRLSETALGRRGSSALTTLIGIASIPIYLFTGSTALLLAGAFLMGWSSGNFGVIPTYLSERFPTAIRAAGAGFAYQAGGGIAAVAPTIIGSLQDRGMTLASAMALAIGVSGILVLILLALGPETRGRDLKATD